MGTKNLDLWFKHLFLKTEFELILNIPVGREALLASQVYLIMIEI